jgi:hypothetical protein
VSTFDIAKFITNLAGQLGGQEELMTSLAKKHQPNNAPPQ